MSLYPHPHEIASTFSTRHNVPESSATDPLAYLPPLTTLQAWVHRPQAVARCSVTDVINLRALAYDDGVVSHCKRDVFLLDHFPCRVVEIVAWVAGVVHKESTVTVTLDDGNGDFVVEAVVRLAQLHIPKPKEPKRGQFRSAQERRREHAPPEAVEALFMRPDIRVADTVRVVGRVDEWARGGREWVRQLYVDQAAGVGYIVVVDPDEEYAHRAEVLRLHTEVYSRPFTMPATPTPGPSPTKSIMSSIASDAGDEDDEDDGRDLPDPASLSASRLTESTFKLYVLDYMTRETARAMRGVMRRRSIRGILPECVPELADLFPEYRAATARKRPLLEKTPQHANVFDVSRDADTDSCDKTPRATFRSKRERERDHEMSRSVCSASTDDKTPVAARTLCSRADRQANTSSSVSETSTALSLSAYTIPLLLAVPTLRDLAARIVDTRARNEEKHRRHRAKHGKSTVVDAQVVADRLARGLSEGSYKLSRAERDRKMTAMTEWTLRQASRDGSVVEVCIPQATVAVEDDPWRRKPAPEVGYLPLPPELLAPLLVPVIAAHRVLVRGTFRSQLERARESRTQTQTRPSAAGIDAKSITTRLRRWDMRWERVGVWAAEAALEWGEAHGVLDL